MFKKGSCFCYHPSREEVEYEGVSTLVEKLMFLHERGHQFFGHRLVSDKEIIEQERQAWNYARRVIRKKYSLDFASEKIIEYCLRTYERDIEKRRTCVKCSSTQTKEYAPQQYCCEVCECAWS